MKEPIRLAIIGTGARSVSYINQYLADESDNARITAMADCVPGKAAAVADLFFKGHRQGIPASHTDYRRIMEDPAVDAVIVTASDTAHLEIFKAAARAGKHILLEKPAATTMEDCQAILDNAKDFTGVIRMGFVLRYSDFYRKIRDLARSGDLGDIVCLEAKELLAPAHAANFFRRWHRFSVNNGGFLNAKCSHDLDILSGLVESEPVRVSAFGCRSFFNPRPEAALYCRQCSLAGECAYFRKPIDPADRRSVFEQEGDLCVFNGEKDIVDHETLSLQYENGVTASFTVSMLSPEGNRTMVICGTKASLVADFNAGSIRVKSIRDGREIMYSANEGGGHGGGDSVLYRDFLEAIRACRRGEDARKRSFSEIRAGVLSTMIALAGEESMATGRTIACQ